MLRRAVLEKYGIRYEEEFSPAEDYMLWLRLLDKTMFHNFQEVFVRYRWFAGNTTHRQMDKMLDADALCRCFAAREYPYLYAKMLKEQRKRRCWVYLLGKIPFLKIKERSAKGIDVSLCGCIPLLRLKFG